MAFREWRSDLQPDEFAFLFASDVGVNADDLGIFLQRAATVGRRAGGELRVIGTEQGSLAVILRAIGKSARTEFRKSPVATTAAAAALIGIVTTAILHAMSPDQGTVTALAKSAANLVEHHDVNTIELITNNTTYVIMDRERAHQVLSLERLKKTRRDSLPSYELRQLIADGRDGRLSGSVHVVDGQLHFRPDNFRYLVPVDDRLSEAIDEIRPDRHYRVSADILTREGQPDRILIHHATRV